MDATLFLENRKSGWMVIAMTNVDVNAYASQVRLTFMSGDVQLSTVFVDEDPDESIFTPNVTAPEGQVFAGWATKEVAEDGTITMTLRYTCDERFRLMIPGEEKLEPAVLYPIFEEVEAVG